MWTEYASGRSVRTMILPPEVDQSTEVAAAEAVRGTCRDVAKAPGWHCELLPDQGPLWGGGSRQRKHSHDNQPRPRLQELRYLLLKVRRLAVINVEFIALSSMKKAA